MKAEARQRGKLLGIGVATCIEPSAGAGSVFNLFQNPNMIGGGDVGEGVRLQVDLNGNVTAAIGFQSAGQGHETTVTQLVCEALQVEPDQVVVVRADSTGGVPSVATTGSPHALDDGRGGAGRGCQDQGQNDGHRLAGPRR